MHLQRSLKHRDTENTGEHKGNRCLDFSLCFFVPSVPLCLQEGNVHDTLSGRRRVTSPA